MYIGDEKKLGHKHITKRAFKTKCRECGKDVLFWECADCHARAFFNLPIYGHPIRHICEKYIHPKQKRLPKWRTPVEKPYHRPLDVEENLAYQCPVCRKMFQKENKLNDHIKQMKKFDEDHEIFFDKVLDLIDFSYEDENEEINEDNELQENKELNEDINELEDPGKITVNNFDLRSRNIKDFHQDPYIKTDTGFGKINLKVRKKKIKGKK